MLDGNENRRATVCLDRDKNTLPLAANASVWRSWAGLLLWKPAYVLPAKQIYKDMTSSGVLFGINFASGCGCRFGPWSSVRDKSGRTTPTMLATSFGVRRWPSKLFDGLLPRIQSL